MLVVPFNVIPPPAAVSSVAPPAVNCTAPDVACNILRVIWVALSTLAITGLAPKFPVPLVLVMVMPGISPLVEANVTV